MKNKLFSHVIYEQCKVIYVFSMNLSYTCNMYKGMRSSSKEFSPRDRARIIIILLLLSSSSSIFFHLYLNKRIFLCQRLFYITMIITKVHHATVYRLIRAVCISPTKDQYERYIPVYQYAPPYCVSIR